MDTLCGQYSYLLTPFFANAKSESIRPELVGEFYMEVSNLIRLTDQWLNCASVLSCYSISRRISKRSCTTHSTRSKMVSFIPGYH